MALEEEGRVAPGYLIVIFEANLGAQLIDLPEARR